MRAAQNILLVQYLIALLCLFALNYIFSLRLLFLLKMFHVERSFVVRYNNNHVRRLCGCFDKADGLDFCNSWKISVRDFIM